MFYNLRQGSPKCNNNSKSYGLVWNESSKLWLLLKGFLIVQNIEDLFGQKGSTVLFFKSLPLSIHLDPLPTKVTNKDRCIYQ